MYSLMAVTFQKSLYPTEKMDWALADFTEDISKALQFETKEQAIDFASLNCNLYITGSYYEWYAIEQPTETIVAQFIRAPKQFLTVSGLYHWLSNLLPYEEIGQYVDGEWQGLTCATHEDIKRVEIQPTNKLTTVEDLQYGLKVLPGDWGVFDLNMASEDWQLSVKPAGFRKWELGCYVSPTYKGFVFVEYMAPTCQNAK